MVAVGDKGYTAPLVMTVHTICIDLRMEDLQLQL